MRIIPARRSRHGLPAALLAGAVTCLAAAAPAVAVSDTAAAGSVTITVHPFTIPPDTGCVGWAEDASRNCDPVNVVFPNRSPARVRDLLRAKGWTTFDLGSTQSLHFATPALYPQDVQVFRPDSRNPLGQGTRYHVRLWQVRGVTPATTVGAVHHEARTGLFSDTIDMDWDTAEGFVAGQLCGPCSTTAVLAKQLEMQGGGTTWRGWANDARATVVP